MRISTIRHDDVLPFEVRDTSITVIGAGATGSHLVMSLVELGFCDIKVFDPDIVEPHNLANQAYCANQVGMRKVDALRELVAAKLGGVPDSMAFCPEAVQADYDIFSQVYFLLTDTMESRRELIGALADCSYVIETRMASNYGNVFGFNPLADEEEWLATLTSDEDAEVSACGTSISVGPTAKITANLAVWHLINYLTKPAHNKARTNFYLSPLMVGTEEI